MRTAVHQFVPSLAPRDAIGAHTLRLQALLRELGYRSEIYADEVKPELAGAAIPYRRFSRPFRRPRTWVLYHSSIGSPIAAYLAERPEPKLVDYHNVTPAPLLEGYDPGVGAAAAAGRRDLARLAPVTELAIADSSYNAAELAEAGFRRTVVVPPLVDPEATLRLLDEETLARLVAAKEAGGSDWLFVGRIAPNKAQHDLVKALVAYRRAYDPLARLHLVGAVASESYRRALGRFVAELGLDGAVEFTGPVSDPVLAAYYRSADVFVCLSDHEGFCVPLVEAMHAGVPVVAHRAAAVPETLGAAGVLLDPPKSPVRTAAAVHAVVSDRTFASALVAAGRARARELGLEASRRRFAEVLRGAVGEP